MAELQIGDQAVRYDRDATAAVYAAMQCGDAEWCGCLSCRNFAAQRDLIYPPSFRRLLDQLGIDPNKEGEAFEYGPVDDGWHLYGGWFGFVGEIVTAGEGVCDASDYKDDADDFEFFFTTSHPKFEAFGDGPVPAIEFTTHIEWVLPEGPE